MKESDHLFTTPTGGEVRDLNVTLNYTWSDIYGVTWPDYIHSSLSYLCYSGKIVPLFGGAIYFSDGNGARTMHAG